MCGVCGSKQQGDDLMLFLLVLLFKIVAIYIVNCIVKIMCVRAPILAAVW